MKVAAASTLALLLLCSPRAAAVDAPARPQRTELLAEVTDLVSVGDETRVVCTRGPDRQVTLTGTNLRISCDRLEVIAIGVGDDTSVAPVLEKFKYLLATGDVVIIQGQREARCGRAEVLPLENKVVLTENPVVIDHAIDWEQRGAKITMFRGERRVVVEQSVLSGPSIKDLGFDESAPPPAPPSPTPSEAAETNTPVPQPSITVPGITPPQK